MRQNSVDGFEDRFKALTGNVPFAWQCRLYADWFRHGRIPRALDLPTGLGKTSVMALWLLARQAGANLPRRLVYVVDRRAVVDQATREAESIQKKLEASARNADGAGLRVSTLRGQFADNRVWLEDPAAPVIVVGTVDMVGSRLLFSGYGVSRGMRPYHAGLLGADSLVVLDESHLVPPFERLLRAIEDERRAGNPDRSRETADKADHATVPPFRLLSLSATGRADEQTKLFQLEPADREDAVVQQRLNARKILTMRDIGDAVKPDELARTLAEEAWELSDNGAAASTCLVYCNSRDVADKTKAALDKLPAIGGKAAKNKDAAELFVGARRVRERKDAEQRLEALGFLAGTAARRDGPSFLVATAAGEVGVDLDADHMVCDLVAFERLVQRFGRCNRRGGKQACIRLVAHNPKPTETGKQRNAKSLADWAVKEATRNLLKKLLRDAQQGIDVSPGALLDLKRRARDDACLAMNIAAATTPEPLYPALTRPLVDAWSMTSLEEHSGRPPVGPWLRGWVEDEPQTAVVWRTHLPVRTRGGDATEPEIEDFLSAAPPHLTERLETESHRVGEWLLARAKAGATPHKEEDPTTDATTNGETRENSEPGPLSPRAFVAFVCESNGRLAESWRLDALRDMKKGDVSKALVGQTLVVDARLGGLSDAGLLDPKSKEPPVTADSGAPWLSGAGSDDILDLLGFRVHKLPAAAQAPERTVHSFATVRSEEGEGLEFLHIQTRLTETSRATAAHAQHLAEHHAWTEKKAEALAISLGLTETYRRVLVLVARSHDEGKRAKRWQRAANAPDSADVYAKTKGPFRSRMLDGYRHEFGSLPYVENDAEFGALSPELQDLVLHLVAAHHGHARPIIPTRGCDDAPPSALEIRARDVALRFARLQERWGPWGLAWWEALLRAADQQASRDNDARGRGGAA